MMASNFIWSRFYIQTSISVKVTYPLIKFSSNLKPQARNLCNNILNNLSVLRLQRRLNFLHNWGCKSLFNTDLIRTSFHRNVQYSLVSCDLFSNNIIISTQTCSFYHSCKVLNESHDSSSSRLYPLSNYNFYCNTFRNYSNKKSIINNKHLSIKRHEYIRGVLREKQRRIRQTQQHLKSSGKLLLDDIKRTKSKMKVRMEEIIERENVWTIPNMLCVARIAISPYLGYVIMQSDYKLALGLLTFAGVTDLLDGLIARTFKSQSSKLGSFLDPMADKVLIATLFLTLTFAGNMPVPLTVLIVTRDVALTAAGFYIRYQSLPPPRTLSRYFDMTHATAQLSPTMISKVNTMIQLVTVFSTVAAAAFECTDSPALYALWYLTAGSTVASAASYLTAKNTYKLLKRKKTK